MHFALMWVIAALSDLDIIALLHATQFTSMFADVSLHAQEPRQKIIDIDTCVQMLSIVMTNQAHLQPFIDFLQHQTEYKFINNDQWMGFYRFSLEVMWLQLLTKQYTSRKCSAYRICLCAQAWQCRP